MSTSGSVGRRVRDEADGRACLAAAAASGLTPHVWARANGVSTRSLSQWRWRIQLMDAQAARGEVVRPVGGVPRPATTPPEPRLVEVAVAAAPASAARYEIVVDRYRVVVGEDFAEGTLTRLLRVVAAC